MADFTLKQHDTWPPIEATLSDANGPIDLTTAGDIKIIIKAAAELTPLIMDSVAITNPVGGRVKYEWSAGDTDVAGLFQGEFEITWSDLSVETIPNSNYFSLEVVPDLG